VSEKERERERERKRGIERDALQDKVKITSDFLPITIKNPCPIRGK